MRRRGDYRRGSSRPVCKGASNLPARLRWLRNSGSIADRLLPVTEKRRKIDSTVGGYRNWARRNSTRFNRETFVESSAQANTWRGRLGGTSYQIAQPYFRRRCGMDLLKVIQRAQSYFRDRKVKQDPTPLRRKNANDYSESYWVFRTRTSLSVSTRAYAQAKDSLSSGRTIPGRNYRLQNRSLRDESGRSRRRTKYVRSLSSRRLELRSNLWYGLWRAGQYSLINTAVPIPVPIRLISPFWRRLRNFQSATVLRTTPVTHAQQ